MTDLQSLKQRVERANTARLEKAIDRLLERQREYYDGWLKAHLARISKGSHHDKR